MDIVYLALAAAFAVGIWLMLEFLSHLEGGH
jgi:hypothetical protein